MPSDPNERENKIFREEMAKQRETQAERDFLKDKSVGGKNAPRPTDDFIDESLGKSMNRQEQAKEAGRRTDKRMAGEEDVDQRREAVERSIRAHNRSLAAREKEKGRDDRERE